MPGMICPNCSKPTFFKTGTGRQCTQCGYTMKVPPNNGVGGKGSVCSNCGKFTVFNGKCTKCSAEYYSITRQKVI